MTIMFATGALERSAAFIAGQFASTRLHFDPVRLQAEMQRLSQQMGDVQRPETAAGELSWFAKMSRAAQVERLAAMVEAEPVEAGPGWYGLTPDGIAVISIVGPLLSRSDWWTRYLDLVTYDTLPLVAEAAATDPRVKGILADVSSPGGHAAGMMDCADRLAAVRQAVPLYAVANPLAASAGYGLACAADRLFVPRMATVGSIGVVLIHLDLSRLDEEWGLKFTAIYSGARKVDGWSHAELSEEARAGIQASVDDGRQQFAEHVAKYRTGMSVDAVLATEADCFDDAAAVSAGLADEVASFDQALDALREKIGSKAGARRNQLGRRAAADAQEKAAEADALEPEIQSGAEQPAISPTADTEAPAAEASADDEPFDPCEGCPTPEDCKSAGSCADNKESSMSTTEGGATAARDEGYNAALAYVAEVNDLCALAGQPGKAAGFIAAKTSVAEIRKALVDARAAEGGKDAITSHPETLPAAQAGSLIKAAEGKAAEMRAAFQAGKE